MSELKYKRVPTTHDVYKVLVRDPSGIVRECMSAYESYTNIVENGICTIYTVWGIKSAEVALVGAETKYETEDDKEIEGTRTNQYWLCSPYIDKEE